MTLTGKPLGAALDAILQPRSLGWLVRDGGLVITSAEKAAEAGRARADLEAALPGVEIRLD